MLKKAVRVDWAEKLARKQHSSLFVWSMSDEEKRFRT
jgi:hypothetical protein